MDIFNVLKKMKILLIDDDEWIRDSMTLFFESEDCRIMVLETAEEGLKEIKAHSYDIILIDYKLPGINGLEFLEQIRAFYPKAVRILLSAYGDSEIIERAKNMGIQDFIEKPFTWEAIEKSLSRAINTYR